KRLFEWLCQHGLSPGQSPRRLSNATTRAAHPFVDQWNQHPEEVQREANRLGEELLSAFKQGRAHELVQFTGETAGMIHEILAASEIVRRVMAQAQEVLARATTGFS